MAIGVTFPENEDVVAFGRKNEMLVLLVSKLGIYKKELGNYAGYWLRKVYWKDLHYRGKQISRNALTHVWHNLATIKKNITIVFGAASWFSSSSETGPAKNLNFGTVESRDRSYFIIFIHPKCLFSEN